MSKGLQHSNALVRFICVNALLIIMRKFSAVMSALESMVSGSNSQQALWSDFMDSLRDDMRAKVKYFITFIN